MIDAVQLLRELIAIPSVNPAFLPKGDPNAGEHDVALHLVSRAAGSGLDVRLEEVEPGRPNVFAALKPPGGSTRRLVLAPHTDTVGSTDPDVRIFDPRVAKGRVHGRGACDTKGSVAAMFAALLRLAKSGKRPVQTEILFVGLVDEESGQMGSRALAAKGFNADLALVGEPTKLEVVSAHKGDLWLEISTSGRAAHGSTPKLGVNAVHRMSLVVKLLEEDYAEMLSERNHPMLGSPTINVGTICGGTQPNIVPSSCVIQVDRRMIPGESEEMVRRELRQLFAANGVQAKLGNIRSVPCPALEVDSQLPWVQDFLKAARRRKTTGVQYFCDAAVLASAGTPSLVFGPGDIAQAHTADEWIEIASLEKATNILEKFMRSLP